jgi:hypothetical protein
MSKINAFNGFDPLAEVWLGGVYPTEFYQDFDSEVRDAFEQITEMTTEDLGKIQKVLELKNIQVQRPHFSSNRDDYLNDRGILIKPPIMPRDTELSLGNAFYHLRSDYKVDPWKKQIDAMLANGVDIKVGPSGNDLSCLQPPSIVRCGNDLYVDIDSHKHVMPQISSTLIEWAKQYRVHLISTGGHSDGVFCPIREGLIITTHWISNYEKTFPGWEVFKIPQEINGIAGSLHNWWVPNMQVSQNSLFAKHIEERAVDWVGNYQETQFSVNMLVIDEKTVLAVNQNPLLTEFLTKKGIEVIIADFRCKGFWDGGMHCLTSDIARISSIKNYFPTRPNNNYLDWIA